MAFDAFLKIDGISGESTGGTIAIESFSWGVNAPVSSVGSGAGAGKVTFSDLTVMKLVDSASPALFTAAATGKLLPAVQLTCRKAGGGERQQPFLNVQLSEVVISSYKEGGNRHGAEFPSEEIAFSFEKVNIVYGR